MRGNPGYRLPQHKKTVRALLANIRQLKEDRGAFKLFLRRRLISQDLLSAEIPPESPPPAQATATIPKAERRVEPPIPEPKMVQQQQQQHAIPNRHRAGTVRKPHLIPKPQASARGYKQQAAKVDLPMDCRSISFSSDLANDGTFPHHGSIIAPDTRCGMCTKYFKELMQSESRCLALTMENRVLKRQAQVSLSAIHPANDLASISSIVHNVSGTVMMLVRIRVEIRLRDWRRRLGGGETEDRPADDGAHATDGRPREPGRDQPRQHQQRHRRLGQRRPCCQAGSESMIICDLRCLSVFISDSPAKQAECERERIIQNR